MPKLAVGAIFGIILGFFVGDLRGTTERARLIARAEAAATFEPEASPATFAIVPGLNGAFAHGDPAPVNAPPPIENEPTTTVDSVVAEPSAEPAPDPGVALEPPPPETDSVELAPEPSEGYVRDFADEFELACEAQRGRRAQARAALIEQADLSDEETARFDSAMAAMSEELAEYSDEILLVMIMDEQPTVAQGLSLAHDVTGIMAQYQETIDSLVGPAQWDEHGMAVYNFIDLEALRPAMDDLQGRNRSDVEVP